MTRTLISRANQIIERVFVLDEEIANLWAFRALLQELHSRDLSLVKEPHVISVRMVRAGILRAAVSSAMACLDRSDRRENRASVGQILKVLGDQKVVATLPKLGMTEKEAISRIRKLREQYETLLKSDPFTRARRLRNDSISHLLITSQDPEEVTYEMIYELNARAEQFAVDLFKICIQPIQAPEFFGHKPRLTQGAKGFLFGGIAPVDVELAKEALPALSH
jgi:hypothetical protein